jgi:hypothetical protein
VSVHYIVLLALWSEETAKYFYPFYLSVSLKHKFILVLEGTELFLGHVDSALTDIIYLSLLQHFVELLALIVETGSTDLSTFIQEMHVEEFPGALLVRPCLDLRLIRYSSLNCPLILVGRERFDWVNSSMAGGILLGF